MDNLIGGHITLDHMYGRMQEHDPARTNVVWPLWIVNCLVTSLAVMLTCCRDQWFIKVLHETVLQRLVWVISGKRLNVSVVVQSA